MKRRLINTSPRREQVTQERLLLILERKFQRVVAAEISKASKQMLARYAVTGSAPALPDDHMFRMKNVYFEMARISIKTFGGRILDQGKAIGYRLEKKDFLEFFTRLAIEYVTNELIRRRIASVAESTRQQIVTLIIAGQKEGLGSDEIARSISKAIPSISRTRGALIARTETHGAANFGADQSARATSLKLEKEWVSTNDHRTRHDHRDADGLKADMDAAFTVGGEKLMYPGDPNGSAGNIINCRCAVIHNVID